jgi:hypothetical protein
MSTDKEADALLDECRNADGTYNGVKLVSRLSEILHPGHGLSEEEVQRIWDAHVEKLRAQRAADDSLKRG